MAKKHEAEPEVDRRKPSERRKPADRRTQTSAVAVPVERRQLERREKVSRRRQIDPTTCERDYNTDEIEFMHALDKYKRSSGRMFPTCSEVLEVLKSLGYAKVAGQLQGDAPAAASSAEAAHAGPAAPLAAPHVNVEATPAANA